MSVSESIDLLQKTVDDTCELIDKLRAEKAELREALADVRELIYGYADAEDGDYGQPEGNKAMRALRIIAEVL